MNLTFGDILILVVCYFGLFTSFYFLILLIQNRDKLHDKVINIFPFVTIIVPAYNEEKTLAKTVASLIKLNYPKDKYEVLVVDDGSTDNTFSIAKSLERGLPFVKAYHIANKGKGGALNFAIKKAKGEFIGALDADSFVHKDALRHIMAKFDSPQTVAVTPSLKVYNAKSILEILQEVEYIFGIFLRKIFAFIGSIHVTPGPFSIYRKSFFDKYGCYDEKNLTEDIEIALRIQSKGFHIENTTNAFVYTVAPKTFLTLLKQRIRWYYGFLINVENYRHLFHINYGNLGVIILPASFISIFLVIISLFYTLFKLSESAFNFFKYFHTLGWDYFRLLNFRIDPFFFNMDGITLLSIVTIIISVTIIVIANRMSQGNKNLAIRFFLYSIMYWFFFGFWWLTAFFVRVSGIRMKWGHRSL